LGFQTPLYELSDYLAWTTSGRIQLPDFQRGYKWEEERIRSLLVTVLQGHPLGVVMLLKTGNDQVRFKPKPLEGTSVAAGTAPELLLLDGQQRLTSLTQALTADGVVATKDDRGKLLKRRLYIVVDLALDGEERIDEAVISIPHDGIIRSNFGKDIDLDVSSREKELEHGYFPVNLLFDAGAVQWLFAVEDKDKAAAFHERIIKPAGTYNIPAIELDQFTSKSAVATVFEKVNTGGLALNVFELLTATFAGDPTYYEQHGTDFRLNDDWQETQERFKGHPTLAAIENTDFLQAVTLLASRKRHLNHEGDKPPAISARREDILKLTLADYLEWVDPLREAFIWAEAFLADRYIFTGKFLPYPKQLVPLAVIKVIMGAGADLIGPRDKVVRWFWSGILGELYGAAIETRFVRDIEQVPGWALGKEGAATPRTVQDANFVESRLHSLRTRNAAAYKGIYALLLGNAARDWMKDQALDKVQYAALAVDIHHIFPKAWCDKNDIDDERRESIVNKTGIGYSTNRAIGGAAPSSYLPSIEKKAGITSAALDEILANHLIDGATLRQDDFDTFFVDRRERLCQLVEAAIGKPVQRDVDTGAPQEASGEFEPAMVTELPDEED
jgi:hypothetical protein